MSYRSRQGQSVDALRAIYGNPFEGLGPPIFMKGSIIAVGTSKCTVFTETGETYCSLDWPNMDQSPSGGGCMVAPPEVGTPVILRKSPTGTVISQTLALSSPVSNNQPFSVSDSNVVNVAAGLDGPAYQNQLPNDAQPGDWVRMGNQGQKIGILEGGVALMSAAPWAAVRANQTNNTLQVFGRNLEVLTGFGRTKYTDIAGKQSFLFEGGTDRLTETGTGLENWTVRALIGGTCPGFADLQFKKTDGDNLFRAALEGDGTLNTWQAGDNNSNIDGRVTAIINNGRAVAITAGNDAIDVAESGIESYGGSLKTDISKNRTCLVGNDRTDMVMRDWIMSAGRNMRLSAGGDLKLGIPGDNAVLWNISNGSLKIDIGNVANNSGIPDKTMGGLDTTSWWGDIKLRTVSPLGKIILDTSGPAGSVLLGSIMGEAKFHTTKYEQLAALVNALLNALDTHVHPTGMGPSGTPMIPPVAATPFTSALSALVTPMMSLKVLIGA